MSLLLWRLDVRWLHHGKRNCLWSNLLLSNHIRTLTKTVLNNFNTLSDIKRDQCCMVNGENEVLQYWVVFKPHYFETFFFSYIIIDRPSMSFLLTKIAKPTCNFITGLLLVVLKHISVQPISYFFL